MTDRKDRLRMSQIALAIASRLPPKKSGGYVVLVTSAQSKEGKSFVAKQIANELCRSLYTDLVLIDTSVAKPTRLENAKRESSTETGLAKLISDGYLPASPPAQDGLPRLLYLSSGGHLRTGLFNVGGVARAFEILRDRFKITVVDAPVLAECGATLMHADAILLVVDSRKTAPSSIRNAIAAAQLSAERITGVVLNHAPFESRA